MLSSLSSFLPSARALSEKLEKLDLGRSGEQPATHPDQQSVKEEGMQVQDEGQKKEKKKKSTSQETFIVVRPPPAMSNHPLNLQIQLVPAQLTKDRSTTTSAATTPTNSRISTNFPPAKDPTPSDAQSSSPVHSETGNDITPQRPESIRSNRSDISFYASTAQSGSVTSFASTTSTSSGRRMIIPLYNLSAHNVMTNTVLDAGTDAKVAKFLKRGMEIISLAILEPTEVWNGAANAEPFDHSMQRTPSYNSLAPPAQGGNRAPTPDSSRISLSSDHSSNSANPSNSTPTPQQSNNKKIFGRMFRRKESSTGGPTRTPSSYGDDTPEPPASDRMLVPEINLPPKRRTASFHEIVLPPVLGLSPIALSPPTGQCVAHVWTVRRWLKMESQGLLSGVIGKISREVSHGGSELRDWEVRFEWARSRSKGQKTRAQQKGPGHENSRTPSRRSSTTNEELFNGGNAHLSVDPSKRASGRAPSPRREAAPAATKAASVASTAPSDEDGDESDPEDSETPWTCTLVLTNPSQPIMPTKIKMHKRTKSASYPAEMVGEPFRLKVGTLSPAPHHPKVVCQLKVPFPLPDVEVDNGIMRKRLVLPDGSTRSTVQRERPCLVMTAEEVKDIVCCTAFWVVIRQGFGGLRKKARKGDGWNIRG